jgi:hypothetical protein
MKSLWLWALLLAASSCCRGAPIVYDFFAPDFGSFRYTSPSFIDGSIGVPASKLDFCTTVVGVCWPDSFDIGGGNIFLAVYFDPFTTPSASIDFNNVIDEHHAQGFRFYFPYGSFGSPGTYNTPPLFGFHTGTLTVSEVGEPRMLFPLSVTLGLVVMACRRKSLRGGRSN